MARRVAALAVGAALCATGLAAPVANAAGPSATLSPSSGWVQSGSTFTLSGSGCTAPLREDGTPIPVAVAVVDTATTGIVGQATPAADGTWKVTFGQLSDWLPTGGSASVGALCVTYGASDDRAALVNVVSDAFDVSFVGVTSWPSSVGGKAVTVKLAGFGANEKVTIVLSGHGENAVIGTGTSDADGNVSLSVTVPKSVKPGLYTITATGATSGRTFVEKNGFRVGSPSLSIPSSITAGKSATVTGTAFFPGEKVTVTIKVNGKDVTIGTGTAASDGTVKFTIKVPTSVKAGTYDLTAIGDPDAQGKPATVVTQKLKVLAPGTSSDEGGMPDQGTDVA